MIKNLAMIIFVSLTVPAMALASGTVSADFLNISVSPYQASLGGASSALSNDIASSYYNPAGLSSIERSGINLMHYMWFQDISYEFIGGAFPIGSKSTFGFSTAYLHMGQINVYNEYDQHQGSISAYSLAGIISYSRNISSDLYLGISGKFIMEKLAEINANGYALDIGSQYIGDNFKFGIAFNNLGPKIKYEVESYSLPVSVSLGSSFSPMRLPVEIIVGAKIPFEGDVSIAAGLDYQLTNFLSLRSGAGGFGGDNISNTANFGIGLNLSNSHIDYAFNPKNQLGSTHSFSFTFNFGGNRNIGFDRKEILSQNDNSVEILRSNETIETSYSLPKDSVYVISAGVFKSETSALKQIDVMKRFGINSKAEKRADGDYIVILTKTDNRKKANKIQKDISSKGFRCMVDVE
ncbi:MAG: PorV/PorQ family protein [candidate division Zixibacteria bacterium]|nr:PorV/PorQ family protein [candidate division Zixibacteria bacterium]